MATGQPVDRTAESFQGLLLRHRGRTGLTQRQLAARVGVSRGSVQDWEAGLNYPDAQHLQALIEAFLEAGGLTVGAEAIDAEALWDAALHHAPRMQTPFDTVWRDGLLARRAESAQPEGPPGPESVAAQQSARQISELRQDWGEAPDVLGFVGRIEDLATLRDWVLEERCRLVAVLGMGGIGKTMLAARLAQEVAPVVKRVYWRSLRDALPATHWLAGAIGFLSGQELVPPDGEAARLAMLLELLRDRPSLLVLDNFETVLEPGQREARYRDGFAGFGALVQALGETTHESCLVLTSREAPPELARLGGHPARRLELGALGISESQVLLADRQLSGNTEDWVNLIDRFGGNGLALKVVGETIREVFGGDIGGFLEESGPGTVFGGIRRLLAEQLDRSSALEQQVLRVLAVERAPMTVAELLLALGPRVGHAAVIETIEALRRRSLAERADVPGVAAFTLQSVVLEYVTDRLVEAVRDEIARGQPVLLVHQPLIKALAKNYVRQSQERLIGDPVLQQLKAQHGEVGTERLLLAMLDGWRGRPAMQQGYGPGNVVNLLRLLRGGDLRGMDFSRVLVRQAYLAGVEAQDASLASAHLVEAVLAQAFRPPLLVALSADGALLAAGTSTGEVWLLRVAERTAVLAIRGHTSAIHSVALSADGELLASGSADGTVRLWEIPSGRELATLLGHSHAGAGHASAVWGVALSANRELVASGSADGTVRLWEIPGGRELATLQGHTSTVTGVALSADGRLLASSSADGTLRLWEIPGGRELATLQDHTSTVIGVALSADGRLLASSSADGTVRLWDARSASSAGHAASNGRAVATLQGHTGMVIGVALSADGRLLASSGADGTVRLWEAPSGRPLAALQGHTSVVWGVALSADGRLVASGSADGTVRLWEAPSGRSLATLRGHTNGVNGVALAVDVGLVAGGSVDGTVQLWEAPSGRPVASLQGHTSTIYGLAFGADGRLLASGSGDGTVRLWEVPSGRPLATLQGHTSAVWGVALSLDGRLLVSGSADGTLRLWEVPSGRVMTTLRGHSSAVYGVALSADGRLLASSSADGTLRLWAVPSGRALATLQGHTSSVIDVALSADGQQVASGSDDRTVRLWEVSSGRELATLRGHTGGVWGVALSADGGLVASGSWDGTVRLWEAASGRELATLQGHTGVVRGVALSSDGRLLASGSWDGTVRLWQTSSGASLRTLRHDPCYERLDITGLTGVTDAQRTALLALGAVDNQGSAVEIPAGIPS